jgi:hypothetical protein
MKGYSLERRGACGCQYVATRYVIDHAPDPSITRHVESPTAPYYHANITLENESSALSVRARVECVSLPELSASTVHVLVSTLLRIPLRDRQAAHTTRDTLRVSRLPCSFERLLPAEICSS